MQKPHRGNQARLLVVTQDTKVYQSDSLPCIIPTFENQGADSFNRTLSASSILSTTQLGETRVQGDRCLTLGTRHLVPNASSNVALNHQLSSSPSRWVTRVPNRPVVVENLASRLGAVFRRPLACPRRFELVIALTRRSLVVIDDGPPRFPLRVEFVHRLRVRHPRHVKDLLLRLVV